MTHRKVKDTPLEVHQDLVAQPLASPSRRLWAFSFDCMLLILPSAAVTVAAAVLSLWLTNPGALRGMGAALGQPLEPAQLNRSLGELAPLLVRMQAPGLPPSVAVAVQESDLDRAGEILSLHEFQISLRVASGEPPLPPGHIRIDVQNLIPPGFRSVAVFGTAALYFTFFVSGRRTATIGKWLAGIQVRRLDGRPLTTWESFERFGGYVASIGTLGLGLLDFWRDPNRRLAHDRISNTVVLRAPKRRFSRA